MSKKTGKLDHYSRKSPGGLGRTEGVPDEDRPFADMRRALHDALRLLSLHRWAFFVPFCLATCAAFIGSLYYPRTYSATTHFEVRNDPVMSDLPLSAGVASFKLFRNTIVRDLTSAECMSEVVETLGLLKDAQRDPDGTLTRESLRRRDALARTYGAYLTVTSSSPSELVDIVRVTYTGPDPTIGRRLVDAVKKTYIRRTRAWIRDFLESQRDYFLAEAQQANSELLDAQREELKLRLDNPYINPADPGAVSARIAQLEVEGRELQLRKRECEGQISAQRQFLATLSPSATTVIDPISEGPISDPRVLRISGRIRAIASQINKLHETRGMTDQHPEIRGLLAERKSLEGEIENIQNDRSSPPGGGEYGPNYATLASEPRGPVQAEEARLSVQLDLWTQRLKDIEAGLETNELTLRQLHKAKEETYEKQEEFAAVLGRVTKAKQRSAQIGSTLSTIEPAIKAAQQDRLLQFSEGEAAQGSVMPISPKAPTIVLLALLAGVVAGVVFVILAEVLDHVYRSSGQVARSLGLPILEAIDEIVTGDDRRRLLLSRVVVSPLVIIGFVGVTGLSGSMAYMSIVRPWTYERIRNIPNAALNLFIEMPSNSHGTPPTP